MYDMASGKTAILSVDRAGNQVSAATTRVVVNGDCTKVAFVSNSNKLVPEDRNGTRDTFERDLSTGTPVPDLGQLGRAAGRGRARPRPRRRRPPPRPCPAATTRPAPRTSAPARRSATTARWWPTSPTCAAWCRRSRRWPASTASSSAGCANPAGARRTEGPTSPNSSVHSFWSADRTREVHLADQNGTRRPAVRRSSVGADVLDADGSALADRAPGGQAGDEGGAAVGSVDLRRSTVGHHRDEGLPLGQVAVVVALAEEVRQRRELAARRPCAAPSRWRAGSPSRPCRRSRRPRPAGRSRRRPGGCCRSW